jgi:predicted nucleic-acid-binding protein
MRIAVDTNILVRYIVDDDPAQADKAERLLKQADRIFVSDIVLCEVVWVLEHTYRLDRHAIVAALRKVAEQPGIEMDLAIFEAGLAMLAGGADFADGVVLHRAMQAKCDRVATFDRRFARKAGGGKVMLLTA